MRIEPGAPGRGEPPLDFLMWTSNIMGRKGPTLMGRFEAIPFMHLIDGNIEVSLQTHRDRYMVSGLAKKVGVERRKPPNTSLLRWMRMELVCKSRSNGVGSMHFGLFAACILGFVYPIRIPEIETRKRAIFQLVRKTERTTCPYRYGDRYPISSKMESCDRYSEPTPLYSR